MTQATIRSGRRMSTASLSRPGARSANLTIKANALTECLLLDGKRRVGVRYTADGQQVEARANREVVVSAGSINSPQRLELSGIGQPELLKSVGIEIRHEMKGVGENLRDHYSPRMKWTVPAELGMTYNDKARGLGLVWQRCATRDPQGAARPPGGANSCLCPHPDRARRAGRRDFVDTVFGRREYAACEEFRRHRDHEHSAFRKHRQHPCVLSGTKDTTGDPLQLSERAARPRGDAGGDAHYPAHHDRARHARHRHRRDRAGREHPVRRRTARLGQTQRRNHLPPGRYLQNGFDPMAVVDDQLRARRREAARCRRSDMPTLTWATPTRRRS